MNDWNPYNTTTFVNPMLNQAPAPQWAMIATLNQATLEVIRQIIREEIGAALEQRDKQGLDNLMADISEPVDEQEEMAAVLATLSESEWQMLVQRVKDNRVNQAHNVDSPPSLQ